MITILRNKVIISTLLVFMLFGLFIFAHTMPVFAVDDEQPDVILYIHGEKSTGGPVFHHVGQMGTGAWAPGATATGTIRIYNNYSERVQIRNLGLTMKLEKLSADDYTEVTDSSVYERFARNMNLTIKKGTLLVFTNTIYNKSFYEMLYQHNHEDFIGYDLPLLDRFSVGTNGHVDLEYTVHMDEKAGNEMQGLRAVVSFLINSHEHPISQHNDVETKNITKPLPKYPDIEGHWAHDCIITLINKEIIAGYPDGTIRPENYVTRAEVAALISRALKLEPKESFFTGYIDPIPGWAKGYIIATSEEDIFKGYPGRIFRANQNITREEMTKVLMEAFEKELIQAFELEFADKDDISQWAVDAVKVGVEEKIIEGYPDNTFRPRQSITRAEAFTMICKLMGYHEQHTKID